MFGDPSVHRAGEPVALGSSKARHILAVLVARYGTIVSSPELCDSLWGDAQPASANRTLQSYLSRLRRALEPEGTIESLPNGYRLTVAGDAIDAVRFAQAVDEARLDAGQGRVVGLARALELVRGRPYGLFDDDPLVRGDAERLAELAVLAREEHAAALVEVGAAEDALAELRRLAADHPLREPTWLLLARALEQRGARPEALRTAWEFRVRLRDELGVAPGDQFEELELTLLEAGDHPADDVLIVPFPPALEAISRRAIAGRAEELAALEAAWAETRRPLGQLAIIEGEAGVGKTRLAAALARDLADRGANVVLGRCEDGITSPYRPFAQALTLLVDTLPTQTLLNHVDHHQGALAAVVPTLRWRASVEPLPGSGGDMGLLVFDAVADLLARAADITPLVVVLEDMHWADETTTSLFEHLVHEPVAAPLMIVATHRDAELDDGHRYHRVLAASGRSAWTRRIPLGGLDVDAVTELLAETFGREVRSLGPGDHRLAASICSATAGNSLFVREILDHLTATGAAREGEEGTTVTDFEVPESINLLVRHRLAVVDPPARDAVRVASVAGQSFRLDVLAAALGTSTEETLAGLEDAQQRGLVRADPGGPDTFRFSHDVVREAVYADLSPSRRARLHAAIAAAMATGADDLIGERAHHVFESAPVLGAETVVKAAEDASRVALRAQAWETALAVLERALVVTTHHWPDDDATRAQLLTAQSAALSTGGQFSRARELLVEAAALAREVGDDDLLAEIAWRHVDAGMGWLDLDDQLGARMVAEATARLADHPSASTRAALLIARAHLAVNATHRSSIAEPAAQALELARTEVPDRLPDALLATCQARLGTRDVDAMSAAAEEGARVASPMRRVRFRYFEIVARINRGRFDEIAPIADDLIDSADRLRSDLARWVGHITYACLHTVHARFDDAEEQLARCRELAHVDGEGSLGTTLHAIQFLAARRRDFDAVRTANDELKAKVPSYALAPRDAVIGGLDGSMSDDDLRRAAHEWAAVIPFLPFWAKRGSTAWMASVIRHTPPDDVAALRPIYEPADDLWVSAGVHETQGHCGWFRGALAEAAGDLDRAIDAYRSASAAHDAVGEIPLRTSYAVWLVEVLLRRSTGTDRAEAARVADEVDALAGRYSIPGIDVALARVMG